jgi:hypothetical protein
MVLWPTVVLHPGFVPEKFGLNQKGISKKLYFIRNKGLM